MQITGALGAIHDRNVTDSATATGRKFHRLQYSQQLHQVSDLDGISSRMEFSGLTAS
jgi:hypothetical protein